jgi:hypothetical protein
MEDNWIKARLGGQKTYLCIETYYKFYKND